MTFPGFFVPVQVEPDSKVPRLVNCTPHSILFRDNDGKVVKVQPSGYTLKAQPIERPAGERDGAELTYAAFAPSDEGERELREIEARGLLPIGSLVSAQAYPGRVVGLVYIDEEQRSKPAPQRIYRCDKFTIF